MSIGAGGWDPPITHQQLGSQWRGSGPHGGNIDDSSLRCPQWALTWASVGCPLGPPWSPHRPSAGAIGHRLSPPRCLPPTLNWPPHCTPPSLRRAQCSPSLPTAPTHHSKGGQRGPVRLQWGLTGARWGGIGGTVDALASIVPPLGAQRASLGPQWAMLPPPLPPLPLPETNIHI